MAPGDNTDNKPTGTDAAPSPQTPIRMIFDQINSLFGNGTNDIFPLEFPARLLEQGTYLYQGNDTINAQQLKPPAVAEAEFRLSNDMYDVSSIVGGANGSKLSERYREVLFTMISANSQTMTPSEKALREDQAKICAWLEELVDNFEPPSSDLLSAIPADIGLRIRVPAKKIDSGESQQLKDLRDSTKTQKLARVDLYQKLLDIYNAEKFRWVQFKSDARPRDFSKQAEVDAYDRLLSTYAPVIDSKLEALWTVLVIRGQYHRVRQYIGYVDVETASETLQRAKENLRSSVSRSIDDTEDIYPVIMTPSNWAKYLSTNFKPEDLLNDASIVRNQLYDAEKSRSMLLNRMNALKASQQDIGKLQTAEESARRDLAQAQTDMTSGYADTVIKLVQLYFDAVAAKAQNAADAVKAIDSTKGVDEINRSIANDKLSVSPLSKEQFEKLRDMQASCLQKQATLQKASEVFSRAQLALAQAKSGDGTNLLAQIQDQIDSLTMDIEYYKKVMASFPNPLSVPITSSGSGDPVPPNSKASVSTDPTLPSQSDGASVWQEIVLTYNHNENASTNLSSTVTSHSDWQTGFWFWSASGTNDTTNSETKKTHSSKDTNIQIAFRVMKVAIQRPWMDAGLLIKTQDFFRATETKIAKNKPADVKDNLSKGTGSGSEEEILPSFATSFVVAKDIHIILRSQDNFDSSYVKDVQESSNSGGGLLCFSISKSKNSSENRQAAVVTSDGKNLSIKIAAPQIIGWICELTPEDKSVHLYSGFDQEEFADAVKKTGANSVINGGLPTPPPELH